MGGELVLILAAIFFGGALLGGDSAVVVEDEAADDADAGDDNAGDAGDMLDDDADDDAADDDAADDDAADDDAADDDAADDDAADDDAADDDAADGDAADDAADDDPAEDEPEEEVEPNILVFNGEDTLEGTDEADILAVDPAEGLVVNRVELMGGNDTITGVSLSPTGQLLAGDGDDVIGLEAQGIVLAGDGDDEITVNMDSELQASSVLIGGAGDDTIVALSNISGDNIARPSTLINGDVGADTFQIELALRPDVAFQNGETVREIDDVFESPSGITLSDFDPDEDSLIININPDADQLDRVISDISLIPDPLSEEQGGMGSQVLITFEATADDPSVQSVIRIPNLDAFDAEVDSITVTFNGEAQTVNIRPDGLPAA